MEDDKKNQNGRQPKKIQMKDDLNKLKKIQNRRGQINSK